MLNKVLNTIGHLGHHYNNNHWQGGKVSVLREHAPHVGAGEAPNMRKN